MGGLWASSWGREGEGEAKEEAKARPRKGEGEGQAKARRRLGQGGGVGLIAVRSLAAGGDKGETWLPPGRLVEHLFSFQTLYLMKIIDYKSFWNFLKNFKFYHFFHLE